MKLVLASKNPHKLRELEEIRGGPACRADGEGRGTVDASAMDELVRLIMRRLNV